MNRLSVRIGSSLRRVSVIVLAIASVGNPTTIAHADGPCRPNSGWRASVGPQLPAVAQQAEQELELAGLSAQVEAESFGETDDCGTYRQSGINFHIHLEAGGVAAAQLQPPANLIYPALAQSSRAPVGRVLVSQPDGTTTRLLDPAAVEQPAAVSGQDTGWQLASPVTSPPGRYIAGLAYDSTRHVTVLFGGDDTGAARRNDTWEFNGANWHQVNTPQAPPGRANIDQTLIYDSVRQRVVLFGGLGNAGYLNDTWEYDGATWTPINTPVAPPQRDAHAMAFDSHRGAAVLFGGYGIAGMGSSDTWEYTGTWQLQSPASAPPGRYHHAMAFDAKRNVTVLFGGSASGGAKLADTWEYDGTTWHLISLPQAPPARDNHSLAYDSTRGVIVLFGGQGAGGPLADTWEYNGTNWRQVFPSQTPAARTELSLVYDSYRGKVVLFGGGYWSGNLLTTFGDTWQYTPEANGTEAGRRKVYVIVYDPVLSSGQSLSTALHWFSHAALTQGTIDFFRQTSSNRVNYTVVDTTVVTDSWPALVDGFQYTEAEYLGVLSHQVTPHAPSEVDYNQIVNSPAFDICGKANRGEIDEVWIYNGPYFGFYESTLVGPNAYFYNSSPVPGPHNCNRLIPIMGPSPERDLDSAIHNFGHRTESTMARVYGSWQENRTATNFDRFALVKAQSPAYAYSGCGNIHFPPNGTSDYDYGNSVAVPSNCADFVNYPNLNQPAAVVQPIQCATWSCQHIEYLRYWFSHLPSAYGCEAAGAAHNWWRYFAEPALANSPVSACSATLTVNFSAGQAGSFFTVTAANFPPNSSVTIRINGVPIPSSLATAANGSLVFVLDTAGAAAGRYFVTVTVNPSVTVEFDIDPGQPLRPQSGSDAVLVVPAGLGYDHALYLPTVQR